VKASQAIEQLDSGDTGLVERRRQLPSAQRARTTTVAWLGHRQLSRSEWRVYGSRLGLLSKSTNWWLGDWIRFGQRQYGDHRYEIAAEVTGYDQQTLMNFAYVAGRFEISRRRETLSWSHHAELAGLDPDAQDRWLEAAIEQQLSVRQLRDRVRRERRAASGVQQTDGRKGPGGDVQTPPRVVVVVCSHCGEVTEVALDAGGRGSAA
jgi:hypothetical protein